MPVDGKYGKVALEHGSHIPDDEPGIWFRAKDVLLPAVLEDYHAMCVAAGSPERHLMLVRAARDQVIAWQAAHDTKVPDSETSREWLPEPTPVQQEIDRLREELGVQDFPG